MKKMPAFPKINSNDFVSQTTILTTKEDIFHVRFRNGKELFLSDFKPCNDNCAKSKKYNALVRGFHTYCPEFKRKKLLNSNFEFQINEIVWVKKINIIGPKSVIKLIKLWPYARKKQGHEIGEIWTVGYYCKQDGLDVIWLVNSAGEYNWTINHDFLKKHYEIIYESGDKDFYGEYVPKYLLCKMATQIAQLKKQDWNMLSTQLQDTIETIEIEGIKYNYRTQINQTVINRIDVMIKIYFFCNISISQVAMEGFSINNKGKIRLLIKN